MKKKKQKSVTNTVYQFKLIFRDIEPLVWRQIQVLKSSTFWELHVALQDSLGWKNVGLHEFIVERLKSKRAERVAMYDEGFGDFIVRLSPKTKIADYFTLECNVGYFHYPLGQEWHCQLNLEQVLPRDSQQTYPVCIGGERMAPPETGKDNATLAKRVGNPKRWGHKKAMKLVNQICNRDVFDKEKIVFSDPKAMLSRFCPKTAYSQQVGRVLAKLL